MLSAADIIRLLELKPHPEGGHFRQTFCDTRTVDGARAASTALDTRPSRLSDVPTIKPSASFKYGSSVSTAIPLPSKIVAFGQARRTRLRSLGSADFPVPTPVTINAIVPFKASIENATSIGNKPGTAPE